MTPALLAAVALATLPGDRVPRALVALVCQAEGCRDQVSRAGAVGLMQVVPRYWTRRGQACEGLDLRQPWDSVECGVRLLAFARATCGEWVTALGWYHTGRCTEDGYARRVMERWRRTARKVTT